MSPNEPKPERAEAEDRIANAIRRDFDPYWPQLQESYNRVIELLSIAKKLAAEPSFGAVRSGQSPAAAAEDVLRAAVVFTHACLEDFLRTLTNRLLPTGDEGALRDIPLAGVARGKSQFHLGQLVQHRQKSVHEVICESVSEHLERSTFNSTTEIAQLLEMLHLEVQKLNGEFPALDRMMRRRHQIVHRSDRIKDPNSHTYTLEPIQLPEVRSWLTATHNFTIAVLSRIAAGSIIEILKDESAKTTTPLSARSLLWPGSFSLDLPLLTA